ncbi:hypothetical protein KGY73_00300 [bacterium]|nr:hypothetical protein [bacterium]
MRGKLILIFIITLVCFSLHSCVIAVRNYPPMGGYPVQVFQKTAPLESGGTVSVKNIYGDVEIVGWDREKVDVYAEKRLPSFRGKHIQVHSFKALLPQIKVEQFENSVQIKAEIQKLGQKPGPVNQYIRVPRPIRLKDISNQKGNIFVSDLFGKIFVELGEGDIHIENCSGSLSASLNKGLFEASLYDLRKGDEIHVINHQGDIILSLQFQVNARIKAQVSEGNIRSEFNQIITSGKKEVQAQIGKDGAQISLSTLKGSIHIKKIKKEGKAKSSM